MNFKKANRITVEGQDIGKLVTTGYGLGKIIGCERIEVVKRIQKKIFNVAILGTRGVIKLHSRDIRKL